MKEETRYARQLFIFGDGTNGPIRNVDSLAKAAGCSTRALREHLPKWREEAEKLTLASKDCPFSLELSSEVLAQHREEVNFLARQVRLLRRRLDKTKTTSPNYPVYLSAYTSALTKWEKSSGIGAQYDVALASLKESARAAARAAAKANAPTEPKPAREVNRGRFDVEG